jgi:hypothetical protein
VPSDGFEQALAELLSFLEQPLTQTIKQLEYALAGCEAEDIASVIGQYGIQPHLLPAALFVRDRLGRINDVIHATAIAVALPEILEPGEELQRPSLAAGNDPTRPFDLETDRRIAEFKLARWRGADAMRKRQLFKDFVHLAVEPSDRCRHLFVLGSEPIQFLETSRSTAGWALDRFPAARAVWAEHFGSLEVEIREFTATGGNYVEIVDLEHRWPALFAMT